MPLRARRRVFTQFKRLRAFGFAQHKLACGHAALLHQPARRAVGGRRRTDELLKFRATDESSIDAQPPKLQAVLAVPEAVVRPDAHLHRVCVTLIGLEAKARSTHRCLSAQPTRRPCGPWRPSPRSGRCVAASANRLPVAARAGGG